MAAIATNNERLAAERAERERRLDEMVLLRGLTVRGTGPERVTFDPYRKVGDRCPENPSVANHFEDVSRPRVALVDEVLAPDLIIPKYHYPTEGEYATLSINIREKPFVNIDYPVAQHVPAIHGLRVTLFPHQLDAVRQMIVPFPSLGELAIDGSQVYDDGYVAFKASSPSVVVFDCMERDMFDSSWNKLRVRLLGGFNGSGRSVAVLAAAMCWTQTTGKPSIIVVPSSRRAYWDALLLRTAECVGIMHMKRDVKEVPVAVVTTNALRCVDNKDYGFVAIDDAADVSAKDTDYVVQQFTWENLVLVTDMETPMWKSHACSYPFPIDASYATHASLIPFIPHQPDVTVTHDRVFVRKNEAETKFWNCVRSIFMEQGFEGTVPSSVLTTLRRVTEADTLDLEQAAEFVKNRLSGVEIKDDPPVASRSPVTDDGCPICYDSSAFLYQYECGHTICRDCHWAWIKSPNASCSVCRGPVSPVFSAQENKSKPVKRKAASLTDIRRGDTKTMSSKMLAFRKYAAAANEDDRIVVAVESAHSAQAFAKILDGLNVSYGMSRHWTDVNRFLDGSFRFLISHDRLRDFHAHNATQVWVFGGPLLHAKFGDVKHQLNRIDNTSAVHVRFFLQKGTLDHLNYVSPFPLRPGTKRTRVRLYSFFTAVDDALE